MLLFVKVNLVGRLIVSGLLPDSAVGEDLRGRSLELSETGMLNMDEVRAL